MPRLARRNRSPTQPVDAMPLAAGRETERNGDPAMARQGLGKKVWVIAEGYIPAGSTGPGPQMVSHETACILNTNDQDARVEITIYFADRPPAGPYRVTVPSERTLHLRYNDLDDPEPVPRDTDYASVLVADAPVVVQHTRLDSRQAENALMTTIAFSQD